MEYVAHVRPGPAPVVHSVEEHLSAVAEMAASFAEPFGSRDWARLTGFWHDLGKYHPEFQGYIRRETGYDAAAHLELAPGRVDHSTLGALHSLQRLGSLGRVVAYAIAGHHAGLPDWQSSQSGAGTLESRLDRNRARMGGLPLAEIPSEILDPPFTQTPPPDSSSADRRPEAPALWLRMLFSCLVDADYLDTEAFLDERRATQRAGRPDLIRLAGRFETYMASLEERTRRAGPLSTVNEVRTEVLRQSREKATLEPGLFSLTVPTGGGKTLSSMAFALRHALEHGKRRILYVIPYTSIIEQTADVFRSAFGADAVLEHHSALDPEEESLQSRLAAENWDAPLVVTTAVQFWESLFAARPGRCRKLHRIPNSVVVLDEAQLIPLEFLKPILSVLQDLTGHYGVSAVLCTATQPALNAQASPDFDFPGLTGVREIMDDPGDLHLRLKRVRVEVPEDLRASISWDALAYGMAAEPQALAIVNRRDDARDLYRRLPEDTRVHLSALMCGEHRSRTLQEIHRRLKAGERLHVVSTQLIEAGVDVDFPVVFRALAGLDSIAQAAGRCNREGRLEAGRVIIFVPPKPAPPGLLRMAEEGGRQMLASAGSDPLAPTEFRRYFEHLYWKQGDRLDRHGILNLLDHQQSLRIQFRTAAERFRLIPDLHEAVVVRYHNEPLLDELEDLRQRNGAASRWHYRRLQRFTVSVPRYIHHQLAARGEIAEWLPGLWVQESTRLYHGRTGLDTGVGETYEAADLIA